MKVRDGLRRERSAAPPADEHFFGLAVLVPSEVTSLRYRVQTANFFKTDPTNIWGWELEARPRFSKDIDATRHAPPAHKRVPGRAPACWRSTSRTAEPVQIEI